MKIDRVRVHGKRRVYVSWLIEDSTRLDWKGEFCTALMVATLNDDKAFDETLESDPLQVESGALLDERLAGLFEAGEGRTPVTDVVAVLTNLYLGRNVGSPEKAKGELARFLDHIQAHDTRDAVRVHLAPIDAGLWRMVKVREIPLRDADSVVPWMQKLRGDQEFTWPSKDREACAREVGEAVERITGDPAPTYKDPP